MLTQDCLNKLLNYDQETGIFTYKVKPKRSHIVVDDIAGYIDTLGYLVICINKKQYKLHRLAWLSVYGYFPECFIDHINHNTVDNRLINLREANHIENQQNRKIGINNSSGKKGIDWNGNRWRVRCGVNGSRITVGRFKHIIEAINARDLFYKKHYGEFYYE